VVQFGVSIFDLKRLPLDVAEIRQPLLERGQALWSAFSLAAYPSVGTVCETHLVASDLPLRPELTP
jgi:hypothetical protein